MGLVIFSLISYALLISLLLRRFSVQQNLLPRTTLSVALVTILLHGLCLYFWIDTALGQNLSLLNVASLLLWIITVLLLILSVRNNPVEILGLLIAPLAACSLLLAYLYPNTYLITAGETRYELLHILISMLAFGVLGMSGCQALLLAAQQYALRHHASSRLILRLPSLETMEVLLFKMIQAGFALLCISLLSGFAFLVQADMATVIEKIGFAFLAWAVFAVLLIGRARYGWRGQRAVQLTTSGFVFLILSYFGSRIL